MSARSKKETQRKIDPHRPYLGSNLPLAIQPRPAETLKEKAARVRRENRGKFKFDRLKAWDREVVPRLKELAKRGFGDMTLDEIQALREQLRIAICERDNRR